MTSKTFVLYINNHLAYMITCFFYPCTSIKKDRCRLVCAYCKMSKNIKNQEPICAKVLCMAIYSKVAVPFCFHRDPNRAPGHHSLNEWPLHTPKGKEYLELNIKYLNEADKSKAVGRGPRTKECAFWKEYLPQLIASTGSGYFFITTVTPYADKFMPFILFRRMHLFMRVVLAVNT